MDHIAGYSEATTEQARVSSVPLSHLSIEVGHFSMRELTSGVDRIRAQFRRVAPMVEALTTRAENEFGPRARVSTCFLIDDYSHGDTRPADVLEDVLTVARECGLTIDYLAREAGCWEVPEVVRDAVVLTPRIELAEMVRGRIVAEPEPGDNGRRPPTSVSGWLCNGKRAAGGDSGQAMHPDEPYEPPKEFGSREHSIFLDVELWRRAEGVMMWSAPYLSAIWQLLRLGVLRYEGRPVVEPQLCTVGGPWPEGWSEMPAVLQLDSRAQPFTAYHSFSILPLRSLGVEAAVRMILDHIHLDEEVVDQVVCRGEAEGVAVSRRVAERISHHHFLTDGS
ncbi:SCO2522 family protein [Nocardia sp. NPDC005366]|uniref:SCO2522 family protein n=1 Tax=Nocardia sp. NPDC005366 TaxID=3156878 RepID=UPI0033BDD961